MLNLMNKILFFISGFLPCKIIKGEQGQPYLERYMVARWGKNGEKTLFLHRFLDSDSDKGIHDHPWNSKSFIVAGGYNEKKLVIKDGKETVILRNIKPFSFNKIGKDDFHQIILKEKTPAWTLFYHGPRVKHWGFQYYTFQPDGSIVKEDFQSFEDKTDPSEHWEKTALRGVDSPRENAEYILNK